MARTFWKTAGNDPGKAESLSNKCATLFGRCWPRSCFVCGETAGEDAVCAFCLQGLGWLKPAELCPCCALPTPGGARCGACLKRAPAFDASVAVFRYATPVREMILALKHGQGFAQIDWLADHLAAGLLAQSLRPDLILPMPLHRTRLRERGFNQAAELARRLARRCGVPCELELAMRDIDTPRLEGLRRRERQRAVRGAFRVTRPLAGLRIAVVDDVMTSGASLDELALTLKGAGAQHVTNLVLARTLRQPTG